MLHLAAETSPPRVSPAMTIATIITALGRAAVAAAAAAATTTTMRRSSRANLAMEARASFPAAVVEAAAASTTQLRAILL